MTCHYFFNNIKKKLSIGVSKKSERNFLGCVCVRGTANKVLFRFIDFYKASTKLIFLDYKHNVFFFHITIKKVIKLNLYA